jgi:hypothetical protein
MNAGHKWYDRQAQLEARREEERRVRREYQANTAAGYFIAAFWLFIIAGGLWYFADQIAALLQGLGL